MIVSIPLRTCSGLNAREHWRSRARRVKAEREIVNGALWLLAKARPPLNVLLTRVAPSNGLDDDNLCGALKAVRDEFAAWVGVDDRHTHLVRYTYAQRRGPWGVEIEWAPMEAGS